MPVAARRGRHDAGVEICFAIDGSALPVARCQRA